MDTTPGMRYKLFGNSGLRISELCLGTMNFGADWQWGIDKPTSQEIFDTFANFGGNYIDSANIYTDGQCETYLADFIAADRDWFVLSTKYSLLSDPRSANGFGNSRKHLISSVEKSLQSLQTEYLDILWVHCWDYMTRAEEIMRSLNDLVSSGKVHHIGLSNAPSWILAQGNTLATAYGWPGFSGIQLEYSLAQRSIEAEFFPLMEEFDLNLSTWSPLGGGILTGKYRTQRKDNTSRYDAIGMDVSSAHEDLLSLAGQIADELQCSLPQLAIAWTMKRNARITPIIGASSPQQLSDNLGCLQVELTDEHYSALESLTSSRLQEPYGILSRPDQLGRAYGEYMQKIDNHRYPFPGQR